MSLPPIEEIQKIGERISSRLGHMFQQVERLARSLDEQEKTLRDLSARVGVLERFSPNATKGPGQPPVQPICYVGRPLGEPWCFTCKDATCTWAGKNLRRDACPAWKGGT